MISKICPFSSLNFEKVPLSHPVDVVKANLDITSGDGQQLLPEYLYYDLVRLQS